MRPEIGTTAVNEAYVNEESREFASKDMRVEGASSFQPGTVLHRFVLRADVADRSYIASPWWFQTSAVRKILESARSRHRGDSTADGQASKGAGLSKTWDDKKAPAARQSGSQYLLTVKTFATLTFFWGAPRAVGLAQAGDKLATGLQSGSDIADIEVVPDPRCVQFFTQLKRRCSPPAAHSTR